MPGMDVFRGDAFSQITLTNAIDKVGYVPQLLGTIPGLFVPVPVSTTSIFIEERENAPALIQTSERGAPPKQKGGDLRTARSFKTLRLAQGSRIMASQIQNVRAWGSETEMHTVQSEVARRNFFLRQDIELTMEHMRLGAIQGIVSDADDSVLYNWATEFEQTIPAEVDFDLDNASPATGAVRKKCNAVRRSIEVALKGLGGAAVSIAAICGDSFWDDLTGHSEVEKTFLNTAQAADLRGPFAQPWTSFNYGNITWINYRGTDTGTQVAIDTNKAKFFPIGAGIFQIAYSPGESFDVVNTMGRPIYNNIILDDDRNSFVDVEQFSYPLPVCTMPQALYRARRT